MKLLNYETSLLWNFSIMKLLNYETFKRLIIWFFKIFMKLLCLDEFPWNIWYNGLRRFWVLTTTRFWPRVVLLIAGTKKRTSTSHSSGKNYWRHRPRYISHCLCCFPGIFFLPLQELQPAARRLRVAKRWREIPKRVVHRVPRVKDSWNVERWKFKHVQWIAINF